MSWLPFYHFSVVLLVPLLTVTPWCSLKFQTRFFKATVSRPGGKQLTYLEVWITSNSLQHFVHVDWLKWRAWSDVTLAFWLTWQQIMFFIKLSALCSMFFNAIHVFPHGKKYNDSDLNSQIWNEAQLELNWQHYFFYTSVYFSSLNFRQTFMTELHLEMETVRWWDPLLREIRRPGQQILGSKWKIRGHNAPYRGSRKTLLWIITMSRKYCFLDGGGGVISCTWKEQKIYAVVLIVNLSLDFPNSFLSLWCNTGMGVHKHTSLHGARHGLELMHKLHPAKQKQNIRSWNRNRYGKFYSKTPHKDHLVVKTTYGPLF